MFIPKRIRSKIIFILHHEDDIYDLVLERRLDPNVQKVGGHGRVFISNPTETTALRHLMPVPFVIIPSSSPAAPGFRLFKPESWLQIIDDALLLFGEGEYGKIYVYKFRRHVPNEEIMGKMKISKQHLYVVVNNILSFVYGEAIGRDLLKAEARDGNG